MANTLSDTFGPARDKSGEAATVTNQPNHCVDEADQKVRHAARETCGTTRTTADICENMEVIGSDGDTVGTVDHVEGTLIMLTGENGHDGKHHFVPLDWVARVDTHVHLSKNCGAAREEWQSASA